MPVVSPYPADNLTRNAVATASNLVAPQRCAVYHRTLLGRSIAPFLSSGVLALGFGLVLGCSGGLGEGDVEPTDPSSSAAGPAPGMDGAGPGSVADPRDPESPPGTAMTDPESPSALPGSGDPALPGPGLAEPAPAVTDPATAPAAVADCSTPDVSPNVLRRLSRLEYQLTLQSLFALPTRPDVSAVPEDSDFEGFRTLVALQHVTTEHLRAFQTTAERLATDLVADPQRFESVVGCELGAGGCLDKFISDFGHLAYRRALSSEEAAALLGVAEETGGTDEEQFVAVAAALLTSPSFLFRVEVGDATEGLSSLSGEELASRLAFTLTGRSPSRQLLDSAAGGALDSSEGLADAARELLSDDTAREYYRAFFQQWLGFEQLRAPNEPKPGWNDAIMLSMTEETERVLDEYVWSSGAHFLDSIVANHTFVRADLAEFYGLPAPPASGRIEFPSDHNRYGSGLLSHASLISAKGDGDKIAHRGAWVMRTFLCVDLQIPTALLDSISDELEGLTYPQMLEKRNSESACAGCHAIIDPIGVGFLQYDAAGQFDPTQDVLQYGIQPALTGGDPEGFDSLGELAAQLRARPELSRCLTDRVFLYTDGREAAAADRCTVAHASDQFDSAGGRFASILEGLVLAPQFRLRRAPAVETN